MAPVLSLLVPPRPSRDALTQGKTVNRVWVWCPWRHPRRRHHRQGASTWGHTLVVMAAQLVRSQDRE